MVNRTAPPTSGVRGARLGKYLWRGYFAAGLALAGIYFLFPRGGLTQGVLYVTLGVSMTCAIAIGIRIYRPTPRLPWYLLLAGIGLYTTVANGIWTCTRSGWGRLCPTPPQLMRSI